jgi:hypothetical protein
MSAPVMRHLTRMLVFMTLSLRGECWPVKAKDGESFSNDERAAMRAAALALLWQI